MTSAHNAFLSHLFHIFLLSCNLHKLVFPHRQTFQFLQTSGWLVQPSPFPQLTNYLSTKELYSLFIGLNISLEEPQPPQNLPLSLQIWRTSVPSNLYPANLINLITLVLNQLKPILDSNTSNLILNLNILNVFSWIQTLYKTKLLHQKLMTHHQVNQIIQMTYLTK